MTAEIIIRWLGGLVAYTALAVMVIGIWRGTQREAGRAIGFKMDWLHSPWFYFISTVIFIGIACLGWKPIPWPILSACRLWMLVLGSLLYFPGMLFLLMARMTLGKNYFTSSSFGVQLFKDHQLITQGPYAIVRHPMYTGLIMAAFGSLLIYFNWTTLGFALFAPAIILRATREEAALAQEFGEQWREYCRRVPAFFPRLRK